MVCDDTAHRLALSQRSLPLPVLACEVQQHPKPAMLGWVPTVPDMTCSRARNSRKPTKVALCMMWCGCRAPELREGEEAGRVPTLQSDVYAWGALLCAIVTGRPPMEWAQLEPGGRMGPCVYMGPFMYVSDMLQAHMSACS